MQPEDIFIVESPAGALAEPYHIIQKFGHRPHIFSTTAGVLLALRHTRPALIITTLTLDDGDGMALCGHVRQQYGYEQPRLICTGASAPGLSTLLRERFAANYLPREQLGLMFAPLLRVMAAVRTATVGLNTSPTYDVRRPSVAAWVRTYDEQLCQGRVWVTGKTLAAVESEVAVALHMPLLEYPWRVWGRRISTPEGVGSQTDAGFWVRLERFDTTVRQVMREFLHSLAFIADAVDAEASRLGDMCHAAPDPKTSQPSAQPWYMLVDPVGHLLHEQFSFLRRPGIAVATLSDLQGAADFVTRNAVVWAGIADRALQTLMDHERTGQLVEHIIAAVTPIADAPHQVVLVRTGPGRGVTMHGLRMMTPTAASQQVSRMLCIQPRRSERFALRTEVQAHMHGAALPVEMLDISVSGMLLHCMAEIPVGTCLELQFDLPQHSGLACRAVVMRTERHGLRRGYISGVAFFDFDAGARTRIAAGVAVMAARRRTLSQFENT